jgi:hypothetical protein
LCLLMAAMTAVAVVVSEEPAVRHGSMAVILGMAFPVTLAVAGAFLVGCTYGAVDESREAKAKELLNDPNIEHRATRLMLISLFLIFLPFIWPIALTNFRVRMADETLARPVADAHRLYVPERNDTQLDDFSVALPQGGLQYNRGTESNPMPQYPAFIRFPVGTVITGAPHRPTRLPTTNASLPTINFWPSRHTNVYLANFSNVSDEAFFASQPAAYPRHLLFAAVDDTDDCPFWRQRHRAVFDAVLRVAPKSNPLGADALPLLLQNMSAPSAVLRCATDLGGAASLAGDNFTDAAVVIEPFELRTPLVAPPFSTDVYLGNLRAEDYYSTSVSWRVLGAPLLFADSVTLAARSTGLLARSARYVPAATAHPAALFVPESPFYSLATPHGIANVRSYYLGVRNACIVLMLVCLTALVVATLNPTGRVDTVLRRVTLYGILICAVAMVLFGLMCATVRHRGAFGDGSDSGRHGSMQPVTSPLYCLGGGSSHIPVIIIGAVTAVVQLMNVWGHVSATGGC